MSEEIKPRDVLPLTALSHVANESGSDVLKLFAKELFDNMISKQARARYDFMSVMNEGVRKLEIAEKKRSAYLKNLVLKGEVDLGCREKFVQGLDKLAAKDFIGLLGAKVRCLDAQSAGVKWIMNDERTLKYLNLDHVSLLMSNTFASRCLGGRE